MSRIRFEAFHLRFFNSIFATQFRGPAVVTHRPLVALLLIASLGLGCALVGTARAQEDPFGGSDPFGLGDPFGQGGEGLDSDPGGGIFGGGAQPPQQTAEPSDPMDPIEEEEESDPVVRLLYLDPPQTPTEMAEGLTWMVRIKRWDEARRLLDQIRDKNWSLEQKAELARAAQASKLLRLLAEGAELDDQQRALIREVMSAPGKLAGQVESIDAQIARLSDPQPGERKMAQLRLLDGGEAALARVTQRLLSGDSKIDDELLAQAAAAFGRQGEEALQAALFVEDIDARARVVIALASLPGTDFSVELGAGLLSPAFPADARAQVTDRLRQRLEQLPADRAIVSHLQQRFEDTFLEYDQRRTVPQEVSDQVWRPKSGIIGVERLEAPAGTRHLERLAQLAAHQTNIDLAPQPDMLACVAVLLQRAYAIEPRLDDPQISSGLLAPIPDSMTTSGLAATKADFWQQVFQVATERQLHGASVRAAQMLGRVGASEAAPQALSYLSKMLKDPRPVVRYTALESIARIDPQRSYVGADRAIETALEMMRLSGGPHALIIGLTSELRHAAEQQVRQETGGEATLVNSAQSALKALNSDEPIELILIVDRVADMSLFELVQRVRNSANGASLPMAILTDQLYRHERELISEMPGVLHSVLSRNISQMQRIIDRLLAMLDTESMAAADRDHFSAMAGKFVATISGQRERYAFYPLSEWNNSLNELQSGMPTATRIDLLSGLRTADSQQRLIDLAANSALSEKLRMRAAKAYGDSVRSVGQQLDRQQVLAAYELYNRLGPDSPVAVRALGWVLDVIEAQASQREWPEDSSP